MKLTKEQVEMIKSDSETATIRHGYDMTIIELCADWLELHKQAKYLQDELDLWERCGYKKK